ncbi:hypothetical protein BOTBODRAFT_478150 [Botryobasidium botryosum FD-172 SS1]|uniref:F-box domain-containing protein n=1 Tax=Botryobasidium botryosum (strain FD-172 SS1) TaxID=930990 RepID=A0A067MT37_BOTB1|nr:hypothetical protein BOTBODRAFT_478150 [Botryobasidium botryosum FD-172 SS1]
MRPVDMARLRGLSIIHSGARRNRTQASLVFIHPPRPLTALRLFPMFRETAEGVIGGRSFLNIRRDLRLPQLKALKITHIDPQIVSAATFAEVLDHLPSIQLLEPISRSPIFVRTLAFMSDRRLCPSLQALQIEHSSITGEDLLTIVESRTQATGDTAPVRLRLVLVDCSTMDQSSVLKLRVASALAFGFGVSWTW